MASQSSQSSLTPRICLSLLKFSYATVAEGTSAPIPWKHITTANDLFVILDTVDVSGPAGAIERRQRFQALQGTDLLEDIDLDILANEARKTNNATQSTQAGSVITVIAKLPCIAMRFPLAGGRVRRFQIRFADAEDFYEMMKRLSKAGVPVIDGGSAITPVASRPSTQGTSGTVVQQPQHFSYSRDRPAMTTVANYVPGNHIHTLRGTPQERCMRPTTIETMPTYGQHVTTNNSPYFNQDQLADQGQSFTPVARETTTHSNYSDVATWDNKSVVPIIDTFTPRPPCSSAPAGLPQEKFMPPKRDLPFARKPKKDTATTIKPPSIPSAPLSVDQVDTSTAAAELPSEDPTTENCNKETAAKGQKRPASRSAKEPAPRKAKTTSTRKKADSKGGKQDKEVPSVEELVREKMAQQEKERPNMETIDTQVLINQAESLLNASRTSKTTCRPGTRSKTTAENSANSPTLNATTEQTDVPGMTRSASNPVTIHSISSDQTTCQSSALIQTKPEKATTTTEQGTINSNQPHSDSDPTSSNAFTQPIGSGISSTSNNDQGTDMSRHLKQRAIETWICKQIQSDEFMEVCKMVESGWARAFLKI